MEGLMEGLQALPQSCNTAAILTDMRSRQDASSPHRTVAHREQLLGLTGQLEGRIQIDQDGLKTAFLGG